MKVFIGGSMSIKNIGLNAQEQLEKIMDDIDDVLIGDADGVDKDAQEYLESCWYGRVTVYACNGKARNNVGDWEVKTVNVPAGKYGREYYEQKDIAMTNDCDYGLMIWDGKSKGTFNNIKRLIDNRKLCIVCIPHLKKTCHIRWNCDLHKIIEIGKLGDYK